MLDLKKKYYVSAGSNLKSTLMGWANENTMKLIGEDVSLPNCARAYQLDVQYNENLSIAVKLLGSGRPNFLNGKRRIGGIRHERVLSEDIVIIYPEIRDR